MLPPWARTVRSAMASPSPASLLECDKGLEDVLQLLPGDTAPGVPDRDGDRGGGAGCFQADGAFIGNGFPRVSEKVKTDLP